jgi:ABC-type glycerol-3-phosphate transport system substrate-binding protein
MQRGMLAQMNEYSPRCLSVEDPNASKVAGKVGYIRFLKDNPEAIGPQRACGNSFGVGINKYSPEEVKDAAYKLCVVMTSYEMQYLAATQWANGPARIDVMNSPEYKKKVPVAEAHLDAMSIVKSYVIPQVPDIVKIIQEELQYAFAKKKTVEASVESMWKRIGDLFK